MAISPSWEVHVHTFLITYITIYPLLVFQALQYLSEQSNDFLVVAASGWTYNMIFIAPMYTCHGATKFHTYTQCTYIHTCRCPHAFHEVTYYAVGVAIGPVGTCAWQDMYVHSTLACLRKKANPNPDKQNHKHKEYGKSWNALSFN